MHHLYLNYIRTDLIHFQIRKELKATPTLKAKTTLCSMTYHNEYYFDFEMIAV